MKKLTTLVFLALCLSLGAQTIRESLEEKKANIEAFIALGGNGIEFNLPDGGQSTKVNGNGGSAEAGMLFMGVDYNQPLDWVISARAGYSSYNLKTDTLDINRTTKGLAFEAGFGLQHRQILFFTLNLGYYNPVTESATDLASLYGGVRALAKIPIGKGLSVGFGAMIGGFFNNIVFEEFKNEGLLIYKGEIVVTYSIYQRQGIPETKF